MKLPSRKPGSVFAPWFNRRTWDRSNTGGKSLLLSWLNTENLCCAFIVISLPSPSLLSQHEEPRQAREHGLVSPFIKHFSGKKADESSKESFLISRRTAQARPRSLFLLFFIFLFLDDKMIRFSYTAVLYLITLIASLSSVSRYWCAYNFLSQFPKKLAKGNTREGLGKRRTPVRQKKRPFFFLPLLTFSLVPCLYYFDFLYLWLACFLSGPHHWLGVLNSSLSTSASWIIKMSILRVGKFLSSNMSSFFPEQWAMKISLLKVF